MRIGELAKTAGITSDTIRFYEREGLLAPPPRATNGYRDYRPETVDDLHFIKKAQALGLRLSAVREVLEISSAGEPPCEHVRATVANRLAEVDHRIRELRGLRSTLRETLERFTATPPPADGCRCSVIESVGRSG